VEELITTQKLNLHIDPALHIWGWEVPVYLFLGGLAAGLLLLGAVSVLRREEGRPAAQRLLLAVTPLLGIGMGALFLDLEHKLHVWRFYTAFIVTAPMSWGSWILLAAVPVNLLLVAATAGRVWPEGRTWAEGRVPALGRLAGWAEPRTRSLAWTSVVLAVAVGIYTGILLSAYGARPFWNTAILGPIFLVSGVSAAAGAIQLASRSHGERLAFERLDVGLILVELFLVGLMIVTMLSGPLQAREAAALVLGGPLTVMFWVLVLAIGLLLPLALESFQLRGYRLPAFLAPALVIAGSLIFRFFIVEAGQATTWIPY
jgi:formate-dependent nitrite reductase membrane component NrfD